MSDWLWWFNMRTTRLWRYHLPGLSTPPSGLGRIFRKSDGFKLLLRDWVDWYWLQRMSNCECMPNRVQCCWDRGSVGVDTVNGQRYYGVQYRSTGLGVQSNELQCTGVCFLYSREDALEMVLCNRIRPYRRYSPCPRP